jgi:hypothetical protein
MKSISSKGPIRKPPSSRSAQSTVAASGEPLVVDPQRLAVERPRHAVDDEARRVGREHRGLPPRVDEGARGGGHGGRGRERRHDLHERQHRRRVEEVHAHHAPRVRAGAGERGHRERRGVGGEHRVGGDRGLEAREQRALHGEVLDHRLDHEPARGEGAEVVGAVERREAGERRVGRVAREPPLLHLAPEVARHRRRRLRGRPRARVREHHRVAGAERDLRDPAAHRAGAHHAHHRRAVEHRHQRRAPLTTSAPARCPAAR